MTGNSNQKGTQALKSRVELDGLMRKLPGGYKIGTYMGDQEPLIIANAPYTTTNLTGGQATLANPVIVPVDYLAVAAYANVVTAPGTAAATISIGILGALTAIMNGYSIATADAGGYRDLTTDASFTGATQFGVGGSVGDVIAFSTNGNATSTGGAIWGCIIVPNG